MGLKHVTFRIKPETYNYVQFLADTCGLPKTYILRRLIEIAVELHRNNIYEFPEGTINYKEICDKFLMQLREGS